MSSFAKFAQRMISRIDQHLSKINRKLALAEENVAYDLDVVIAKLGCSERDIPDISAHKARLIGIRTKSLRAAKQRLTRLRGQLAFCAYEPRHLSEKTKAA